MTAKQPRGWRLPAARAWSSVWLLAVWLLLWGTLQPLVVLSGLVLALVVPAVSALPVLTPVGRRAWHRLPVVGWRILVDLVLSCLQVIRAAVLTGPRTRSAIIAVHVPCTSDLVLAAVCNRISAVPGTLVVDIDRAADLLYVHVLDVPTPADVPARRAQVQAAAADLLAMLEPGERG